MTIKQLLLVSITALMFALALHAWYLIPYTMNTVNQPLEILIIYLDEQGRQVNK